MQICTWTKMEHFLVTMKVECLFMTLKLGRLHVVENLGPYKAMVTYNGDRVETTFNVTKTH